MLALRDARAGAGAPARHRLGIPTAGLPARVLVAKYADRLSLYRQEASFSRVGMALSLHLGTVGRRLRRTAAAARGRAQAGAVAVDADETPVANHEQRLMLLGARFELVDTAEAVKLVSLDVLRSALPHPEATARAMMHSIAALDGG